MNIFKSVLNLLLMNGGSGSVDRLSSEKVATKGNATFCVKLHSSNEDMSLNNKYYKRYCVAKSGLALLLMAIWLLLPVSPVISKLNANEISPFTVIKSTQDEIVLEWNMPDYKLTPIEAQNSTYHIIEGDFINYHSQEGYPKLPYFTENVGIPADGEIQIFLSETTSKSIKNVVIYPAEKMVVKNDGENSRFRNSYLDENIEVAYEFYQNRNAYRRNSNYPETILEKGASAFAGDRHFAAFILNPFLYNASSKELTLITKGVITIRILGNKAAVRSELRQRSYIDKAGDLFFINNEQSKNWRKERDYAPEYTATRSNGVNEIQFVVDQEGIYQVTYEDLKEHIEIWIEENGYEIDINLDTLDPRYLELSSQYGVTPIHFEGERTGTFSPGDYFEFYGQKNFGKTGHSDSYTAENIYTLKISDNWGARMAVESGGIKEINPRKFTLPNSYEHTVHFEQQSNYSALGTYLGSGREDLWFWKTIRAPDLSVTPFELEYPHDDFMKGFTATVCLVGSTDIGGGRLDHHARIRINASFINDHRWGGQTDRLFTNSKFVSNQHLNHGTNHLYIDLPGDTDAGEMEAVFLDYLTLTYWREYKANNDYIKFSKPSNRPLGLYQFNLENFSTDDVSVYKVNASVIENLQIEPFSETGLAPFVVSFQDVLISDDTEYIAVAADKKLKPKRIHPRFPSDLKNPDNAADYLIVTVRDFMEAEGTERLKGIWESYGYTVQVIDVQNIFDEFNYGVRSADAMKDFFAYAYNNWTIPMTDVLLLGKGIYDERDFSSSRDVNLIPYKNIWTYKLGATPSDNWFACIVGNDNVPDFNIARITAWNEEQITAVVDKTVKYLESPNYNDLWHSKITLVAGGQGGGDEDIFARQNENIRKRWIPKDYDVLRVYSAVKQLPQQYVGGTFRLRDSWNDGTALIQFMGHGGGRIWADYNLLNNNDIATLNNANYPFVSSLSCYPSDFGRPGAGSIGENMVLTAGRGAIAHFGFSGLGYLYEDETVGYHLCEAIFSQNLTKFGDIVSFTIAKTYSSLSTPGLHNPQIALVQSAILFGDPMLSFNIAQDRIAVGLEKYYYAERDTVKLKVDMEDDIQYARVHIQNENEITLNVPYDLPVINGSLEFQYVIPKTTESQYSRLVKVYGYSNDRQVLGMTKFSVGKAAVIDNKTIPEQPTVSDSVHIAARFFNENGVKKVVCKLEGITEGALMEMILIDKGSNLYRTKKAYPAFAAVPPFEDDQVEGIRYHFLITNENDREIKTESFSFLVLASDLNVYHLELGTHQNKPAVKTLVKNLGTCVAPASTLNIYSRIGNEQTLLKKVQVSALEPLEEKWVYTPIEPLTGSIRFVGHINENNDFIEADTENNRFISNTYTLNMFYAGVVNTTAYSSDNNLKIEIPANLFFQKEIFFIESTSYLEPLHQPDAHRIPLTNNALSTSYRIGIYNTAALQDSTGLLPSNKRIKLTIGYNAEHDEAKKWEGSENFNFFSWENEYSKWINQGGFLDKTNKLVFQEVSKLGTYTILHNTDTVSPTIRANVQDQEFTYGGYISGTGVISLMLSDANGIDIFDREITLYLNENKVSEDSYTIAANPQNLTSIPVKFQLDLEAGSYVLFLTCSDVNGNFTDHSIDFDVSNKFDVINLANYPNPVVTNSIDPVNANRTRFTYVLTDDADDVKIKIYTVSGRLVKTMDNLPTGVGYHEYPRTIYAWDCRDDKGVLLANGIYFYKIVASKNNKIVERVQKMAIAR